ncbi:MAG: tRNA glutamyl-Q(34) synthetase GluQRS [Sphingomonadales bacterium]
MSKPFITRFAPSPTGLLHLGHAFSALLAYRTAQKNHGRFLLRIEDIDTTRSRPEFEDAIYRDLTWLGLTWEIPVRCQVDHFDDYQEALNQLDDKGVLYPCFCSRAEIRQEIKNSTGAPHGPEGPLYPGTCRKLLEEEKAEKIKNNLPFAIRLNTEKALKVVGENLFFKENGTKIKADPKNLGDVVLGRKETPSSYHLSVVVDDHLQNITHIIRGQDLFHTTPIHCLLQKLLGFQTPEYHHHALLVGEDGKRFAKRDKSITLESLKKDGRTISEIERLIAGCGGSLEELPF